MRSEAAAFYRNPSGDVVADATNGMIYSAAAYNRICEYLHKQLVRKGRANIVRLNTKKWGNVYFCKDRIEQDDSAVGGSAPDDGAYNINSGGVQAYTYDGYNNLGLSQMFNRQKPTERYNGPEEGEITDYFWVKKTKISDFSIYCKNFGSKFTFRKFELIVESYRPPGPPIPYKVGTSQSFAMAQDIAARLGITEFEYINGYLVDTSEAVVCVYECDKNHQDDESGPYYGPTTAAAYPLFYADSNTPIMGIRRWVKNWNKLYGITYHTKTKKGGWYKQIILPTLFLVSILLVGITAGAYGPAAAATMSAIAGSGAVTLAGVMATLAIVGAIGGFLATLGMISGVKALSRIGRVMGWVGTIGSIYTSVKSLFTQSVAAQNASTATNQAVAGASGANQTCQLYNGVSVSSWAGTNAGVSSAVNAAQGASIGGFAAAGATSTSQLYLTTALKIVGIGSKAFALVQDIRSEFRKHGDTQDTDMQEQSEDEKVISVNSDAQQDEEEINRRYYQRDEEYDIGLEGGTLISIDDSVLDEPNSAVKSI